MRYALNVMNSNPFFYGRVVQADAFCNRLKEIGELERSCKNLNNVFLYSERRLGKTSLVFRVLNQLPKDEFITIYVDLWPTYGEDSFILTMAKAVAQAAGNSMEKLIEISKSMFTRLLPTFGVDEQGRPTVTFGLATSKIDIPALEEVLEAPTKLGKRFDKKCVVVFDEFQEILQYEQDTVERKLRSITQHHTNVGYVFMGSRKHLIQKMFSNSSRPLYRSAAHFPLAPIAKEHWVPFIAARFNNASKFISKELIGRIFGMTDGHPFYTQQLCHLVWEITSTNERVSPEIVANALETLLDRESYAFTTLFDSLSPNQKRLLETIATDNDEQVQVYESDFVARARLKSVSAIQSAIKVLMEKDIVDRTESGGYFVSDRFLKLWLVRRVHNGYDF